MNFNLYVTFTIVPVHDKMTKRNDSVPWKADMCFPLILE